MDPGLVMIFQTDPFQCSTRPPPPSPTAKQLVVLGHDTPPSEATPKPVVGLGLGTTDHALWSRWLVAQLQPKRPRSDRPQRPAWRAPVGVSVAARSAASCSGSGASPTLRPVGPCQARIRRGRPAVKGARELDTERLFTRGIPCWFANRVDAN